jgi:hypothetical protein
VFRTGRAIRLATAFASIGKRYLQKSTTTPASGCLQTRDRPARRFRRSRRRDARVLGRMVSEAIAATQPTR